MKRLYKEDVNASASDILQKPTKNLLFFYKKYFIYIIYFHEIYCA